MCFRESDGRFLWQAVTDKLDSGWENDWPEQGVASNPYVDGDRVTFVDGETRRLSCHVNGSHPAAEVRITVAGNDVTDQFTEDTKLVRTGPTSNTSLEVRRHQSVGKMLVPMHHGIRRRVMIDWFTS